MESLYDVWNAVCEESKKYITEVGYNVWIKDLNRWNSAPASLWCRSTATIKNRL